MHEGVPAYLAQLLRAQYGEETAERIAQGYAAQRVVTLRANPLKTDAQTVRERLAAQDIETSPVPWYADAMIVRGAREDALTGLDLYERGEIYLQSLSSMIPPLLLGAKPGENVLDMAAAPGGKTTQIAALTGNQAMVTACEMNKIRAERLRYNVQRQGATRVTVMNIDSRNLDDLFSFDRILLDAPCSGSGTVQLGSPRSKGQFSREFLSRTTKQQEALLHKALRLLRPGCEMIYSTCSVLTQENEEIVSRVLRKTGAQIVPLELTAFDSVPRLPVSIPGTLCVAPDELHEGFFVAKIRRMK
ncbi:MAG: RsmB/NOP family class I SAM-dependent RNA methyltransferase [Clostridiales bacterium]|nr:RsmB/NOP family class I SAM-dependent RNA methyltransferase [Clostridiales bacterium]MDY3830977.1 RsmB/NOP family class I SAM-dependent RNA methyltransferase [Candidatus Ventricola sp.]